MYGNVVVKDRKKRFEEGDFWMQGIADHVSLRWQAPKSVQSAGSRSVDCLHDWRVILPTYTLVGSALLLLSPPPSNRGEAGMQIE